MMAYSNAEQIFMDVLGGRSPSPSEQLQIDALLAILTRAGFVVNEPSNAAHVTLLAWGWARETGRNDVLTALHNNNLVLDARFDAIHQEFKKLQGLHDLVGKLNDRPLPVLDTQAVATALLQAMPAPTVADKIDTSILKGALTESVSKLWLIVAGAGLALCFWGGMKWAQHQVNPVLEQLQAQNQQLINRLSGEHHAR